jgi:hypothetical protein
MPGGDKNVAPIMPLACINQAMARLRVVLEHELRHLVSGRFHERRGIGSTRKGRMLGLDHLGR